ncbi:unnamed protein product [Urochloa humidicola]
MLVGECGYRSSAETGQESSRSLHAAWKSPLLLLEGSEREEPRQADENTAGEGYRDGEREKDEEMEDDEQVERRRPALCLGLRRW